MAFLIQKSNEQDKHMSHQGILMVLRDMRAKIVKQRITLELYDLTQFI